MFAVFISVLLLGCGPQPSAARSFTQVLFKKFLRAGLATDWMVMCVQVPATLKRLRNKPAVDDGHHEPVVHFFSHSLTIWTGTTHSLDCERVTHQRHVLASTMPTIIAPKLSK